MSEPTPEPTTAPTPQPEPTPAPAPSPEPTTTKWVNEDGTFNRDSFSDDLGKHSSFDKWGNIEEYIKGSINQSKFVGQKAEEWFNSDDPDVVTKRAEIMGVPISSDDYEVAYPETFSGLPEDSQGAIKSYFEDSAKWAHENGVPKEMFEKFAARDLERAISVRNDQVQAQDNAFADATDALKQEWRGDKFAENVEKSDNMAKFLGMEILIPIMEANPEVRKAFFDGASKITSDDTIVEARQRESMATLGEQRSDLDAKMLDPKFDGMPYAERMANPEYRRLLDKAKEMDSRIYGK